MSATSRHLLATFDSLSTGNQSDFGYTGRRTRRALASYGRLSMRVRAGALRQATFSSRLIVGAFLIFDPSSMRGAPGPFLPAFDEPRLLLFDSASLPDVPLSVSSLC